MIHAVSSISDITMLVHDMALQASEQLLTGLSEPTQDISDLCKGQLFVVVQNIAGGEFNNIKA